MRRLCCTLLVASVLLVAPLASAQEAPFAPDSEVAGFLWPAAFGLYGSRTIFVDAPVAYLVVTPRVLGDMLAPRDAGTIAYLVKDLRDPHITVKDPIAAELRRRTGQDFGYADSSSWPKRQQSVSRWASWARRHRAKE